MFVKPNMSSILSYKARKFSSESVSSCQFTRVSRKKDFSPITGLALWVNCLWLRVTSWVIELLLLYSDPVLLLFENNIVSIICFYFIFFRAIKTGMIWIEQYYGDKSALWTVFFQVSILGIVPLTSFMEIEIASLKCFDTVFQRPYRYFSSGFFLVRSL